MAPGPASTGVPDADIPLVQPSVQTQHGAAYHYFIRAACTASVEWMSLHSASRRSRSRFNSPARSSATSSSEVEQRSLHGFDHSGVPENRQPMSILGNQGFALCDSLTQSAVAFSASATISVSLSRRTGSPHAATRRPCLRPGTGAAVARCARATQPHLGQRLPRTVEWMPHGLAGEQSTRSAAS